MRKVFYIVGKLKEADIDFLIKAGNKRVLPAGTILIRQGRPIDHVYIVLDGELVVRLEAPQQKELARIGCGELVGEMSFLDTRPPAATVEVVQRCAVLAIPRAALAERLARDADFASRFYHALGILLAYRLRNHTAFRDGGALSDDTIYDDELDPQMLDQVALAGARFDWMLRRLG
jgi:CRP/FNR family cyclic AMP-dependent transcriptional regulator